LHQSIWKDSPSPPQGLRTLLERFGKSVDDAQSLPELFQDLAAAETAHSGKMPDRAAPS
jgi:hypothetical protein